MISRKIERSCTALNLSVSLLLMLTPGCLDWNARSHDSGRDADRGADGGDVDADVERYEDSDIDAQVDAEMKTDADRPGDSEADIEQEADAEAPVDADEDSDDDSDDDGGYTCPEAIACFIDICGSDDGCIMMCLDDLCPTRRSAAFDVVFCAADECLYECQEPGEQSCEACVNTDCELEMDSCLDAECD